MANAVIEGKQGESMEAVDSEVAEEVKDAEPESIEEVVASEETVEEKAEPKKSKKIKCS